MYSDPARRCRYESESASTRPALSDFWLVVRLSSLLGCSQSQGKRKVPQAHAELRQSGRDS